MRRRLILIIIAMYVVQAHAFDPVGPPPVWTLTNTCSYLTKVSRPKANIVDATVSEVLDLLRADRPRSYAPSYQADEALLVSHITFSIDQKDISDFDILAKLAEKIGANLVISPGKVLLTKRSSKATPKTQ